MKSLLVWPPFAFKTERVLVTPAHSFSKYLAGGCVENLPQFFCRFSLTQYLLTVHVIPDWLHDAEIRALWRPDILLQDSLFLCLNSVFYDSGCVFWVVVLLQNEFGSDTSLMVYLMCLKLLTVLYASKETYTERNLFSLGFDRYLTYQPYVIKIPWKIFFKNSGTLYLQN